ncbi:MAG: NAD(P)-dependent glycerol-3-phosphate dehydrogenase [Thermaerobacter sp.]|nr:NAD(P)-dependent glycerol-3-phosphate dehydrogenase [Thermaerobacter sp.]
MKVAVLGAGGFGTALAAMLARRGHHVSLWCRRAEQAFALLADGENATYLPGVPLPSGVQPTASMEEALSGAHALLFAVPSQAMRATLERVWDAGGAPPLAICTAKGLELSTLRRMSEVAAEFAVDTVQLSGPSHAEELGRDGVTVVVAAHPLADKRQAAQDLLGGATLRTYGSPDRIGVELGGALKNVLALASGVSEGLGFGDNLRAALLTRGLAEITRLGVALGAEPATFSGLAGLGDLLATVISPHSRNRRAGIALGKGTPLKDVLAGTPMVIEGVPATQAALALSRRVGAELPIAAALSRLLFEGADPAMEVAALLQRAFKEEERWRD